MATCPGSEGEACRPMLTDAGAPICVCTKAFAGAHRCDKAQRANTILESLEYCKVAGAFKKEATSITCKHKCTLHHKLTQCAEGNRHLWGLSDTARWLVPLTSRRKHPPSHASTSAPSTTSKHNTRRATAILGSFGHCKVADAFEKKASPITCEQKCTPLEEISTHHMQAQCLPLERGALHHMQAQVHISEEAAPITCRCDACAHMGALHA
eukprot:894819-Pelagomonas_calceolata.AAC.4